MKRPNFFIVGAPKCGTTALHAYLKQHPEIYMAPGEPAFFCPDMDLARRHETPCAQNDPEWLREMRWLHPNLRPLEIEGFCRTKECYFSLFLQANDSNLVVGEKSTQYFYSEVAAQKIYEFEESAKIIIMLRNPIEMVYSLHGQFLDQADEDISDFAEALAAEGDRRRGRRIPSTCLFPWELIYTNMGRYYPHVKHFLSLFPRNNIKIVFFDDFRTRTAETYRDVLGFLGVDPSFSPNLRPVNPHSLPRSRRLQALLTRRAGPRVLFRLARAPLIHPLVAKLRGVLGYWNQQVVRRPPLQREVADYLREVFSDDVCKLEELVGRSLEGWRSN